MFLKTLSAAALVLVTSPALASGPVLHPNSTKYAERNPSAATGRAGNASLEVRALLAKDGSTLLEVTTGKLDSGATPPGNLAKVQVKTFNGDGDVVLNHNFTGLTAGGAFSFGYDGLFRGQSVQTQANITGIDGKRTNVVTVEGTVKLRPDLAIESLDAPGRATVGAAVNIVALVRELNQDVGATGNCVLAVDGAEVDRAPGIWVDAGGTVSCAFTHELDTTGTKTLTVSVTDVTPGDWDVANNSASRAIEVVSSSAPFYWGAGASHYEWSSSGRSEGWSRYDGGDYASASDWNYSWDHSGWHQYGYLYGSTPQALSWPLSTVEHAHATGDQGFRASFSDLSPDWSYEDPYWNYGYAGVWRWDLDSNTYFYLQTYHSTWDGQQYGSSWTESYRYAGAAVYLSRGYSRWWYRYYDQEYSGYWFASEWSNSYGQRWSYGPTYDLDLTIADASGTVIETHPSVELAPYRYDYDYPFECWDDSWSYGQSHSCYESHTHQSGVWGWTYGQN